MKNVAFITGISGQDGSYLSEFLLGKNYKVKAIDIFNQESNWAEFNIAISKYKTINSLFQRFFDNHPYLYKILEKDKETKKGFCLQYVFFEEMIRYKEY